MLKVKGFTLLELMIALAVLAIVLALAGPSFTGTLERSRADADTGELLRALNFARMEAINSNQPVTITATEDDDWTDKLEVTRNNTPIRAYSALSGGAAIETTNNVGAIVFDSLGGLRTPANQVVFTYTRGSETKSIVVCPTGRIIAAEECI